MIPVREDTDRYHDLFVDDVPLLDVRAPVEYAQGAFPRATNLPLLDDTQRERVGIRYREAGQDAAIRLGRELVTPEMRLAGWRAFCRAHPEGYLYCFRGGLRSRTTQQWLREAGIDYPLVRGGYKAMRRFLIEALEISAREIPLVSVGGLTGTGKTRVLSNLLHHLDLEGLANHRGSAFGRNALDRQPAVIDFENAISIGLLKHRQRFPATTLFVEDEGRLIGRLSVPECLYESMLRAPRAMLRLDIEARVEAIAGDYFLNNWPDYRDAYGDSAEREFTEFALGSLARIEKRLGGERYRLVRASFEAGLKSLFDGGGAEDFHDGIRILLEQYYDPMYRYQVESKQPEILFEGSEQEFYDWAGQYGR